MAALSDITYHIDDSTVKYHTYDNWLPCHTVSKLPQQACQFFRGMLLSIFLFHIFGGWGWHVSPSRCRMTVGVNIDTRDKYQFRLGHRAVFFQLQFNTWRDADEEDYNLTIGARGCHAVAQDGLIERDDRLQRVWCGRVAGYVLRRRWTS